MDANGARGGDSADVPRGPERAYGVESGPARSGAIFVVEDDRGVSEALVEVLSDEGYEVMTAGNGAEALARLREAPTPALIVLDLMMPVMDGYAFRAEQLRTPAIADIPVIVLTAGAAPRATELGHVDILKKPIDLGALLDAVGRYV
ncbi:response regulator [Sorangium sp. So ce1335]|uniref:response regulator n=1 Tax=Sorangium sp. So ce1335 TaxID=3133335 RepID=UPI003F5FBB14